MRLSFPTPTIGKVLSYIVTTVLYCFVLPSIKSMYHNPIFFFETQVNLLSNRKGQVWIVEVRSFNMPTSYQWWVWEREANINWSMVTCQGSTRSEVP